MWERGRTLTPNVCGLSVPNVSSGTFLASAPAAAATSATERYIDFIVVLPGVRRAGASEEGGEGYA